MYLSLSPSGPIKWNHNQESSLIQDVSPFSPEYDGRSTATLSEKLRELYLQFLWLPESIMPLNQFVQMIQSLVKHSANDIAASDDAHPLHAALDGILLTGKWCSYKYQEQLPNVVVSHASCTDLEASIMLFVWERHAPCPGHPNETAQNPMNDKKCWLAGIEKREVKIQILLHLLKLSLSGHCPPVPVRPVPSHARKRRRVQPSSDDDEDATPRSILEDRLEGLMDRLVLWQMALPDAETADADVDGTKALRDWTQTFCDDVVQPAFSEKLPEQYKLLRRKLFRIPQWTSSSDSESGADEDEDANSKSVQGQHPDPPTLFDSHANATTTNNAKHSREAARSQSRSRSLSVSLEQEAAAGLRRTESKPRRVLQREVSMSKVFKNRRNDGPNAPPPATTAEAETVAAAAAATTQSQATKGPIILVESTPQKPKAKLSKSKSVHARHRKPS